MVAVLTTVVVGLSVSLTLIVGLILCVCGKVKNTRTLNSNHQNHTEDNLNNNEKQEDVTVRNKSNGPTEDQDPERKESVRPKTLTMNRKLPEIPHIALSDSAAELYATVIEAAHNSSRPPSSNLNETVEYARSRPTTSKSLTELQTYKEPHSYARVNSRASDDMDTYCDPRVYAKTRTSATRSWDPTLCEPPPVPDKHFEATEKSVAANALPSAASAVAGNPSLVDIPFMTSPVHSTQNLVFLDNPPDSDTYGDGSTSSEIRYTSISVREPLANIRAQMAQQALASGVAYRESHYSVVSDEGEQTYAEIESAAHSAASSTTYTRIDAPNGDNDAATPYFPPAPPTVESLRTVAQAHSRQASSSSCISDGSCTTSPGTERSFVLSNSAGNNNSQDISGMYSTVDKSKKLRSTVHVMENGPAANGGLPAIEEMYAKVKKNRPHVKSLLPSDGETGARPKYSMSLSSPHGRHNLLHGDKEDIGSTSILRRQSSGKDDPGYEKIRDRQRNLPDDDAVVIKQLVEFEHVEFRAKNVNADWDPGYEVVKSESSVPGYETIKEKFVYDEEEDDDESVHGYEKVKKPNADNTSNDEGYEQVRNGPNFSRSDPGYESVRYDKTVAPQAADVKGHPPPLQTSPYWTTQSSDEVTDPLYERINNPEEEDDHVDPNYEKVKTVSELSYETSDPGYERVGNRVAISTEEDGYECIHDHGGGDVIYEQADPGYELIKERRDWCDEPDLQALNSSANDLHSASRCQIINSSGDDPVSAELLLQNPSPQNIKLPYKSNS